MKRLSNYRLGPISWAAGLILAGIFLLLLNFEFFARFEPTAQYLLAALLALAGAGFFLAAYASPREDWAQLIPAWTLLSLASMALTSTIAGLDQRISASLIFVGLTAAFAHIYLLNRQENWWAIIPGGFMLVLAAVIALSVRIAQAELLAALLFLGLGGVFLLVFAAPTRHRQWWSLVPAAVLILFGIFVVTLESVNTAAWLRWWPLLLIFVGGAIGFINLRRPQKEKLEVNTAPPPRRKDKSLPAAAPAPATESSRAALGEYVRPAPGATVEVLTGPDDDWPETRDAE